jgi:hypothetical protein
LLTLILLASLGQVYAQDFYFTQAQENWVIDQMPKPVRYSQYLPAELTAQVDIWDEDCARCRRNANTCVIAMGPDAIRWLMWTCRSKSVRISMHSEACITALIRCKYCKGEIYCPGFVPIKEQPLICDVCETSKYWHAISSSECSHCINGFFEIQPYQYSTLELRR